MKCTRCKQGDLKPDTLEGQLACRTCTVCAGHWLLIDDYLKWLESADIESLNSSSHSHVEADESTQALTCPVTGRLMLKYRISHNTEHRLDLSPTANGIWLDQGEWQLMLEEGLAGSLNKVFTAPWQRQIRENTAAKTLESNYQLNFGDDYDKIKGIREFLSQSDKRSAMLAYLNAEDPYSTTR